MAAMAYVSKEEQELWKDLEEGGLLPIEIENGIIPECATYKGTFTEYDTTYEEWEGVSGKTYWLILERYIKGVSGKTYTVTFKRG